MRMAIRQRFLEPIFDQCGFARALNDAILERGLSYRSAALEIGASHSTLHRIASGKFPPDVETYLRISLWLETRHDPILIGSETWRAGSLAENAAYSDTVTIPVG